MGWDRIGHTRLHTREVNGQDESKGRGWWIGRRMYTQGGWASSLRKGGGLVQGQKLMVMVCFCRVPLHKAAIGAGKCRRRPQQQSAVRG